MNYVKAIDNGNYYVEEDILIKKESSYYDKKTSYYIQLKNEKKLIRVTKKEFDIAEAGDKYYKIYGGKIREVYNSTIYQLEDESRITKKYD